MSNKKNYGIDWVSNFQTKVSKDRKKINFYFGTFSKIALSVNIAYLKKIIENAESSQTLENKED